MRRAEALDIPIKRPSVYPPNSLLTARVALLGIDEGWGVAFTKEAFSQHWLNDVAIGTDENTRAGLAAIGQNPDEALDRALGDSNKEALRSQTQQAVELGLFGSLFGGSAQSCRSTFAQRIHTLSPMQTCRIE